MDFIRKILILFLVLTAMYLAYIVVNFLKAKIKVRGNLGAFLILMLLSFGVVFLIIISLGFVLTEFRSFFFHH
jgi:predicted PurR-regulated permease PerM